MKYINDIILRISLKILEEMRNCVKNATPNEACGLIFGQIKEHKISNDKGYQYFYVGERFKCFESDKKSPVSFLIDNFEEFNKIFKSSAEDFKLKLISIFHSHPAGSQPSGVDLNHMKFLDECGLSAFKYQIWTIMDAMNKELNGFIYLNKELMQIEIEIQEN